MLVKGTPGEELVMYEDSLRTFVTYCLICVYPGIILRMGLDNGDDTI